MKTTTMSLLLGSLLLLSACATIVGGTDQMISIDSNVKGADVTYNGVRVGVTPFTGRVKKAKDSTFMVSKAGYEAKQQVLMTSTPTIFWGNILLGGTVGTTVDYASGAMFEVTPANFYINLEPVANQDQVPTPTSKHNFTKDTDLKKFSMVNYQALSRDIARGDGEYLRTLLDKILVVKESQREHVVKRLKIVLAETDQNAIRFGEALADYYFHELNG